MRIVVVGDVLLDTDLRGEAGRLSPDAPVPVVDVGRAEHRAGGAGLVARMLARDGHDVDLVTVLSDDGVAAVLRQQLDGITVTAGPSGVGTPVKTRVRAGGQSVVRFDEGCGEPVVPECTEPMLRALEGADAVVVADYGRGLAANSQLRARLGAVSRNVPVVWDPHPSGAEPVPGIAAVTPNFSEAVRFTGADGKAVREGVRAAADAADVLRRRWQSRTVVVTMGAGGALICSEGTLPQAVPAPKVPVLDPCGAGDRFAASLAVGLAQGKTIDDAAQRAVQEAAAFLAAGGVGSLAEPLDQADALDQADGENPSHVSQLHGGGIDALRVARRTRDASGTVVATGGCFDLLHAGHARTLAAARKLGDCLIVCLNSDDSVRRLKGDDRPIMNQEDRAELLAALECVDAVLIFAESTPEEAIAGLKPDIWVKGGDYSAEDLPEARLLSSWGGRTVTVPYIPARSTTKLAAALATVG